MPWHCMVSVSVDYYWMAMKTTLSVHCFGLEHTSNCCAFESISSCSSWRNSSRFLTCFISKGEFPGCCFLTSCSSNFLISTSRYIDLEQYPGKMNIITLTWSHIYQENRCKIWKAAQSLLTFSSQSELVCCFFHRSWPCPSSGRSESLPLCRTRWTWWRSGLRPSHRPRQCPPCLF